MGLLVKTSLQNSAKSNDMYKENVTTQKDVLIRFHVIIVVFNIQGVTPPELMVVPCWKRKWVIVGWQTERYQCKSYAQICYQSSVVYVYTLISDFLSSLVKTHRHLTSVGKNQDWFVIYLLFDIWLTKNIIHTVLLCTKLSMCDLQTWCSVAKSKPH